MAKGIPYLLELKVLPERIPAALGFPFNLPFLADLDLTLESGSSRCWP